jgi:hypothetical protein
MLTEILSASPVEPEREKGILKRKAKKMDKKLSTSTTKRLTVSWNAPGMSSSDTGSQSMQMAGAANSGCCRQNGSPCSPKKFSK